MVIQHNNTELTRVQPSPEKIHHSAHFDYTSEEEQLTAIISQSEHCEQELSYHCKKSRLLNTPGENKAWWCSFLESNARIVWNIDASSVISTIGFIALFFNFSHLYWGSKDSTWGFLKAKCKRGQGVVWDPMIDRRDLLKASAAIFWDLLKNACIIFSLAIVAINGIWKHAMLA